MARAALAAAALVRSMSDREREARAAAEAEQAAAERQEVAELSAVRESVMSLRRPEGLEELCEGDYLRHGGGGPGEQAARS